MELNGEVLIAAPRARVWSALNDPALLARAIEGCEALEPAGENRFEGVVAAKVGPVRARFGGTVELSNLDPPHGYTLSGEGKGGAAGFARGSADVRLEEADGGASTLLTWTAKATVGGKLAQLGARLVEGAARAQAEKFFTAFKAEVEGPAASAAADGAAVAPAPAQGPAELPTDPLAGPAEAGMAETAIADSAPVASSTDRSPAPAASPSTAVTAPASGRGLSLGLWSGVLTILVLLLIVALLLFDR
ncbi:MAG: CoxG family protein [Sphingomonadaceae bacterium]